MTELKVCFIGVGSIAKRHIINLSHICEKRQIALNIDAVRRCAKKGSEAVYSLINNVYGSVDEMPMDYDVIFITNPTECHLDTLNKVSSHGKHFFIEKPITSMAQLEAANAYVPRGGSVYYVACPLRYNAVIQYIKKNIDTEKIISVRSISSSYLPDWRPGQDYRNTYSAHKDMGGGVSIDLIHEWDYLTFLFGKPGKVNAMVGKKSNLDIDSDDYAIYIAEYTNKVVELHLDYFGRKTIREMMLFTEEDTIVGDIANNRISFLSSNKVLEFQEERDDYQIRELEHFLDMIEGKVAEDSDIKHAIDVLRLTQGEV
ncbi:hypothetical protein D081_0454 [Anaerovibrio sp. JC8]|uniref:Gfo/Idh/MocA family oxidoreductase n=1 Tax=Anaerovibrio sp. JC8 TaxID=1240085 RepID=UPI000A0C0592|nr:Gfo/Idh/MocA family oxidoreductase [Anaerovibrio sp. JC8]ORU01006.1 hypothetical protein D081_0454 [Anaerovibrio sp. JC8]